MTEKILARLSLKPCAILLYILLIFMALMVNWLRYSDEIARYQQHLKTNQDTVQSELNKLHQFATSQLQSHYQAILASDGTLPQIQEILKQSTYLGNAQLRFIWADDRNIIQLSSHTQHLMEHSDLSALPSIAQARGSIGSMVISPIMPHPLAVMNRSMIAYSIGVEHPRQQGYFGTLYANIDLLKLGETMPPLLADCECLYALYSPKAELILHSNTVPERSASLSPAPHQGFHIQIAEDPIQIGKMKHQLLLQLTVSLFIIHLLVAAVYVLIRHRILRPVSRALALMIPPAIHATSATAAPPPSTLEDPFARLQQFAEHYRSMQSRLSQQETLITNFTETMQQLHAQQQRFMAASSREMQGMHASIKAYAEHLEDRILSQQLDPDAAYDFDDVREMGDNLRAISQCYALFATHANGEGRLEIADPKRIFAQSIAACEPMLERRNVCCNFECKREVWITLPAAQQWLQALSQTLLYAAIRVASDEAELTLTIAPNAEKLHIVLSVSKLAPLHESTPAQLHLQLKQHANIMIAEAIAGQLGGAFAMQHDAQEQTLHFKVSLAIHQGSSHAGKA